MVDVSQFTGLITSQHRNKPLFVSMLSATIQPLVDTLNLLENVPYAYDVDTAFGTQLDVIGLWVGASRYVSLPIMTYFSWDTQGVGWDQGIWWRVGDPDNSVTALSDGDYRQLIRAKIRLNHWTGDLPTACSILETVINDNAVIVSADEGTSSVTFNIKGSLSLTISSLITGGYLPLSAMGIATIYNITD